MLVSSNFARNFSIDTQGDLQYICEHMKYQTYKSYVRAIKTGSLMIVILGGLLRLEGPVFMRRPGSLLKSPSVDSESSDPSLQQANRHYPLPGYERRQLMAARYR